MIDETNAPVVAETATADDTATRARLDDAALDVLFREARTHNVWQDRPVPDELLAEIYEISKWGPTSANMSPLRIVFVRTEAGKARLLPAVAEMNQDKTRTAPVTAIFAYDTEFYDHAATLIPYRDMRGYFAERPADANAKMATDNAMLQSAYAILAARALGLDCGPMGGFNAEAVDQAFFPDGRFRTAMLCNIGYGDATQLWPRMPRLDLDTAVTFA